MRELGRVLAAIIALAIVGYAGLKTYIYRNVAHFMDNVVRAGAGVVAVKYAGVTSSLSGTVGVEGITIKPSDVGDEIRIGAVLLNAPNLKYLLDAQSEIAKNSFPRTLSVSLKGIEVDMGGELMARAIDASHHVSRAYGISDDGPCESPDIFQLTHYREIGYEKLIVNLDLGYEWIRESNQVRLQVATRDDDANGFSLETVVTLPNDSEMSKLGRFRPRMISSRVLLQNKGLMKKLTEYCTREKGLDAKAFAAAKAGAPDKYFASEWGIVPGPGLRAAYEQHIVTGEPLSIVMKPNSPVSPDDFGFYTPADLVNLLHLDVKVGERPVENLAFRFPEYVAPRSFGQQFLASMPELRNATQDVLGADDVIPVAAANVTASQVNTDPTYRSVRSSELAKHIGRDVRIATSDGQTRAGWLEKSNEKEITISWYVGGGEMSAVIPYKTIKKAEVLLPPGK